MKWIFLYFDNIGEVGNGEPRSSSPLIDVEAVSDDESNTPNSAVGQSTRSEQRFSLCLGVVS